MVDRPPAPGAEHTDEDPPTVAANRPASSVPDGTTGPPARASRISRPDADLDVQFDVAVIDGEAGRRLAALQADAVLDVLTWLHEQQRPSSSAA